MANPTAPVRIDTTIQVLARDTSNPEATKEFEETVGISTTVANYASDLTGFATQIWNREQALLTQAGSTGVLSFIQGKVVVDDVTAAPATPSRYWTDESTGTPVAKQQSYGSNFRANFTVGPSDFSDATTLATYLTGQIQPFINSTGF